MSFSLHMFVDHHGTRFNVTVEHQVIAEWVEHKDGTFSLSAFNTHDDIWIMTKDGSFAPETAGKPEKRVAKQDLLDATEDALQALTCNGFNSDMIETLDGHQVLVDGKPVLEFRQSNNIDGFDMWCCALAGEPETVVVPVSSLFLRDQTKWFNPYPFAKNGDHLYGCAHFHFHELLYATPLLIASASIFKKGSRF